MARQARHEALLKQQYKKNEGDLNHQQNQQQQQQQQQAVKVVYMSKMDLDIKTNLLDSHQELKNESTNLIKTIESSTNNTRAFDTINKMNTQILGTMMTPTSNTEIDFSSADFRFKSYNPLFETKTCSYPKYQSDTTGPPLSLSSIKNNETSVRGTVYTSDGDTFRKNVLEDLDLTFEENRTDSYRVQFPPPLTPLHTITIKTNLDSSDNDTTREDFFYKDVPTTCLNQNQLLLDYSNSNSSSLVYKTTNLDDIKGPPSHEIVTIMTTQSSKKDEKEEEEDEEKGCVRQSGTSLLSCSNDTDTSSAPAMPMSSVCYDTETPYSDHQTQGTVTEGDEETSSIHGSHKENCGMAMMVSIEQQNDLLKDKVHHDNDFGGGGGGSGENITYDCKNGRNMGTSTKEEAEEVEEICVVQLEELTDLPILDEVSKHDSDESQHISSELFSVSSSVIPVLNYEYQNCETGGVVGKSLESDRNSELVIGKEGGKVLEDKEKLLNEGNFNSILEDKEKVLDKENLNMIFEDNNTILEDKEKLQISTKEIMVESKVSEDTMIVETLLDITKTENLNKIDTEPNSNIDTKSSSVLSEKPSKVGFNGFCIHIN